MVALLLQLLQVPSQTPPINPACERVLSAARVGRIAGVAGVHLVPRDPSKGAGGICNYALAGDTLLVIVMISRSSHTMQQFEATKVGSIGLLNQQPVSGLGDEAFTYGQYGEDLLVRKGNVLVGVTTFVRTIRRPGRVLGPRLSRDQLVAVAQEVLTRS